MLTSSANQYLRPEYLSPLPTTLDANKSPLALLAKTCSSIGVDSPNSKLLGGDKSKDHNSSHHNNSGGSDRKKNGSSSVNSLINGEDDNSSQSNTTSCNSSKLSFKPYEITTNKKSNNFNNNIERNSDFSNDVVISDKKSPQLKVSSSPKSSASIARTSPLNGSTSSGKNTPSDRQDRHSSGRHSSDRHSMSDNKREKNESNSPKISNSTTSASDGTPVNSSLSSSQTSSALSFTSLGLPDMRLTDGHKDSMNSLSNLYKSNPYSSNCCPINGIAPSGHLAVDKTGAYPSIYPPLSYARMKTSNGGQAILPMCRDPYCTGTCQLKAMHMQNAALLASAAASCNPTSCPNGCNQCDHQRIMSSLAAYSQLNPALIPGLSQAYSQGLSQSFGSSMGQNYASGLYSPLTPGLQQRPQSNNVCNWIAGDTHCGKRFSNSEELLQHLRTHTSSSTESSTSVPSLISPSLSSSFAAAAGCHMHYSTAGGVPPPSLTTAAGLRRTYPTSLSPLSNRFHPYKPSVIPGLGAMPSVSSVPPMANPLHNSSALSMYYPYGLYTGRIGPQVHQ